MLLASCSDTLVSNPQEIIFPDTAVSYRNHVRPFLGLACAYSGCHSDEFPAGGVRLTSYFTLFESPGLIIAGKPDQSKIILILENTLPHPLTFQQRIAPAQQRGMRTWVGEGARDN